MPQKGALVFPRSLGIRALKFERLEAVLPEIRNTDQPLAVSSLGGLGFRGFKGLRGFGFQGFRGFRV